MCVVYFFIKPKKDQVSWNPEDILIPASVLSYLFFWKTDASYSVDFIGLFGFEDMGFVGKLFGFLITCNKYPF